MKKRFFAAILTIAMLLSLVPVTASAATADDLTYEINDGEVTVTGCAVSASGELVIPDTIEGNPVTAVGDEAFHNCKDLMSITIPDSVTDIGDDAFRNCKKLTSVTIGDGVTAIGENTFAYCDSLANVTIGGGVTAIGAMAFYDCSSLKSVTIPDSVTTIGKYAFSNCASLKVMTLGDGVTAIGDHAFSNCTNLDSMTIPDSVTAIGGSAFEFCRSLESVTIPDSVTSIGDYAFYYCKSLESVTIPDSVITIGAGMFMYCDSLTSVTIPDSVTSIGENMFYDCTSLKSVTIPDNVTAIGGHAFERSGLTSVTIPGSTASIGEYAFHRCASLTDVYYSGTQADWSAIDIDNGSEALNSAQLHCITAEPSEEPAPTESSEPSADPSAEPAPSEQPAPSGEPSERTDDSAETPDNEPAPAETDFQFADDTGSGSWGWASQYIYAAYEKGIFKGDSNGCFNPDNRLTRAEAVTALLAFKGIKVDTTVTVSGFTDADGGWYTPYAAAAKAAGISSGYDNGDGTCSFKPNASITRAEFVTMLLAAAGVEADANHRASDFADADGSWYTPYIAAAKAQGLSSGYANGDGTYSFKPAAAVSRAEAATMTAALFD